MPMGFQTSPAKEFDVALPMQRAVAGISGNSNPDLNLAGADAPAQLRGARSGVSADLDDLAAGIGEV